MRKPLSLFLTLTILCAALTGCTFHSGSTSAASTSAATPDGPTLRLGVYLPQDDPVAEAVYAGAEYALLQRPSIQLDGVTYSVELYWPSADDDASLAAKLADANCAAILGGLDETDAYNLSDEYIRHIDGLFSIDACVEYLSSRAIQLVRAVVASKKEHALSPRIKACTHYIHVHLHDKLTVGALAEHVGLSEGYLSRLFRQETGQSLSRYILCKKLEAALPMLDAGIPYGQVAYNLAFCSQSHFIHCFKAHFGTPPAAYLRRRG